MTDLITYKDNTYRKATAQEVGEAHPKCGDGCDAWTPYVHGYTKERTGNGMCIELDRITDEEHYCPHHTELTKGE